MILLVLLFSSILSVFCLHDGTVCDCPKPHPCPVLRCPIRACAPSLVFSSQMHSTAARVRRHKNIKQVSSYSLPVDSSSLRKVTLGPLKPLISRPFILPNRHATRISSVVEDYPTEEELKELDRLPVVKTSQEVHQSLELSTTFGELEIITSTVPTTELKPSVSTIPSATKQNKKKRKHRKITTTTEQPSTSVTIVEEEFITKTELPSTTTADLTTVPNTTTRPPPAVTVNDSTEIKEEDVQEEQTTASTIIIVTTEATTQTTETSSTTTTSMPQISSPQDLKGLDLIVADVSLPHMKRENVTNEVPVVSAGYKTNPQFAPEEVNVEDEKCNDEDLLKLLIEAMQIDDSNGSKRAIGALLSSGQTKFSTGQVSVMCTQHQMAFRLVARKYCQLTAGSATCITFML